MSAKKWCIIAIAAAFVIVAAIVALNYVFDPFGVFGDKLLDWDSYNMTNNPRAAKTTYIEEHSDEYDSYIVGCSSSSSFSARAFEKELEAKFYNMIMYGADMADSEKTVKYLIENHKVKNIVLNVYLGNAVTYDVENDSLTHGLHHLVSGESALRFYTRYLFANPLYSVQKLTAKYLEDEYLSKPFDVFDKSTGAYDKRKRDAEPISHLDKYLEKYPVFANYPKAKYTMPYINENAESVRRIKEMCDAAGVNLITVTAPVYYDYFLYFSKEDIQEFYRTLAEASGGFWDFAVSSVSLDPRYFYDETHFRNAVGDMATARIFETPDVYVPDDFGKFITTENYLEQVDSFYGLEFDDTSYRKKVTVFLYHHISEDVTNPGIVSPEAFDRQLAIMKEAEYTSVTLEDLYNFIYKGIDLPENSMMITFDDGYRSNMEIAEPILEKYGFKAVVFTVGSAIGDTFYKATANYCFPHLTYEDNDALNKRGTISVQSHTYDMHQMPEFEIAPPFYENMLKLEGEDDWSYVRRVKEDCRLMEEALGYKPMALAFPHGKGDELVQSILAECGIKFTFTTQYDSSALIKGLPQSGYMLGRYTMYEDTGKADILHFLSKSQNW